MKLRRALLVLFSMLVVLMMVGCGGSGGNLTTDPDSIDLKQIKKWIGTPPQDGYLYGGASLDSRDLTLARNGARLEAENMLARQVETTIEGFSTNFQEQIGEAAKARMSMVFKSRVEGLVSTTLKDARNFAGDFEEVDGGVYRYWSLIRVDEGKAAEGLVDVITQDEVLYQEFKASQFKDEMDAKLREYRERRGR